MDINNIINMRYSTAISTNKSPVQIVQQESNRPGGPSSNNALWQGLSKKYNVESMSVNDMKSMSQELYDNGIITPLEHLILTFPETSLKEGTSVYFTKADENGNRNWIDEFEGRLDFKKSQGGVENSDGAFESKVLAILQKISTAGTSSINDYA